MPTEKQILTFAVDDDLLRKILDFRFDNRIETKSEAIRILVEEGLKRHEEQKKSEPGQGKNKGQKEAAQQKLIFED